MDNYAFKNLKKAEKRAEYIIKKTKWWDKYVPKFIYRRLVVKTPFVDNYSWLMQDCGYVVDVNGKRDFLPDLCVLDMWAGSINRWCDKNIVDDAPFCIRKTCREFMSKRICAYNKL
jgi:hypothetical protein